MLVSIDVDRIISPNDEMFAGNEKHYFGVGRDAFGIIERALISTKLEPGDMETILDFPCGHGRVLRYLRAGFPKAKITGCDLNRDGVDFCASRFGSIPVYSSVDPTQIDLPRDHFDLIWVGSLFTHFDAPRRLSSRGFVPCSDRADSCYSRPKDAGCTSGSPSTNALTASRTSNARK